MAREGDEITLRYDASDQALVKPDTFGHGNTTPPPLTSFPPIPFLLPCRFYLSFQVFPPLFACLPSYPPSLLVYFYSFLSSFLSVPYSILLASPFFLSDLRSFASWLDDSKAQRRDEAFGGSGTPCLANTSTRPIIHLDPHASKGGANWNAGNLTPWL